MSTEQVINLLDKVLREDETLTFAEESTAESFRMYVYRLRRYWKKNREELYFKYEDIVIRKDKLHPNILDFTCRGRCFQGVLEKFGEKEQTPVLPPLTPEEVRGIERKLQAQDKGGEILSELGYAPTRGREETQGKAPREATTFDGVYSKVIRGEKLTKEEEEILNAGAKD